jgi:predicted dehydrogenase
MASKLKVGVVGAGGVVRAFHMPGWAAVNDAEVVAVCDIHQETAEKLAHDFQIPTVYSDYRKMIADPAITVIDVATPNKFHTPVVLAALKGGKHVLCEKPLATTTKSIKEIGQAAQKAKGILMVAQNMRFSPAAVAIKRFLEKEDLGHVYHARIHAVRRNWMPARLGFIDEKFSGGGPCMDIGVHALDLGMWLMGFPKPVRVSGRTMVNFAKGWDIPGGWGEWDRDAMNVEDFASGFIHFENGATMVLEAAWLQHQKEDQDFSAMLYGHKGSIHWPTGQFSTAVNRTLVDSTVLPATGLKPSHTEEIIAFANAIREGKPTPVPYTDSLKVITILEAIYKSSKLGREIKVSV